MAHHSRSREADSPPIRVFEETTPPTVVIDLGPASDHLAFDVVGDSVIIVDESTGEQFEYSLPGEHRRTFMQNGILTIEVEE